MSIMEWNERLDIGVEEMNDQHKGLLNLMNELHEKQNSEFAVQLNILNDLANKTISHFKEEESYMEQIEYPGLKTHKIIHEQLLNKFIEHKKEIESSQKVPHEFFQFLKHWLSAHIVGIDQKYGEHSKKA